MPRSTSFKTMPGVLARWHGARHPGLPYVAGKTEPPTTRTTPGLSFTNDVTAAVGSATTTLMASAARLAAARPGGGRGSI